MKCKCTFIHKCSYIQTSDNPKEKTLSNNFYNTFTVHKDSTHQPSLIRKSKLAQRHNIYTSFLSPVIRTATNRITGNIAQTNVSNMRK